MFPDRAQISGVAVDPGTVLQDLQICRRSRKIAADPGKSSYIPGLCLDVPRSGLNPWKLP